MSAGSVALPPAVLQDIYSGAFVSKVANLDERMQTSCTSKISLCHWLSNFDISVLFHSSFLHAWRHTAAPCELYWTGFLVTLGACSAGLQEHILAAGLSWGSAAISTPRSAIDYTCSTTWKRQKGSFRTGHCWSQTQKNAEFVEHISVRWWANLCSKYVVGYEAQEDIVTHTSLTKSEL